MIKPQPIQPGDNHKGAIYTVFGDGYASYFNFRVGETWSEQSINDEDELYIDFKTKKEGEGFKIWCEQNRVNLRDQIINELNTVGVKK